MNETLQVKEKYTEYLMSMANVVSVGVGFKEVGGVPTGEVCIVVGVTEKVPCHLLPQTQQVPRYIEGIRVDVQQVGIIRALQDRTGRVRPAPGGVSIGHTNVTAGTLGCLVYKGGELFILSNNHVLADSNRGKVGDPILQPGVYDGGAVPGDVIAELAEFVPINFDVELPDCPAAMAVARLCGRLARPFGHGFKSVKASAEPNLVDCAIARPLSANDVTPNILEIGVPAGVAEAELGAAVRKSGRTTRLTSGRVTQVAMTVNVWYETGYATFWDQVAGDLESGGGDSGSVVFAGDRVVGLLFAGGEGVTVFNKIQHVETALQVTL